MAQKKSLTRPATVQSWLRPLGVGSILFLCFLGIIMLAVNVWRELVALERLSADNTQWALMQTEVEMLRLQLSVETAIADGENTSLEELRQWFNVVYSRVDMLPDSQAYAATLRLPEFAENIKRIQAFLHRTVPLIDGPDSELRASLRSFAEVLPDVRQAARQLTLKARNVAAISSDKQRSEVIRTLLALGVLTVVLLLALSGLALVLLRLMRNSRAQIRENSLTSARLQTIFSTSADAIIVTNRGGWIVDINPAAEAVFGHKRDAVLGVHAFDLLLPPELATAQSKEIAAILDASVARTLGNEQGPLRIELLAMRSDGARFPVELSLGTMRIATGGIIVALVRDISDRRIAQGALTGALEQAQAGERTKADFIAVMSHEMRTPLNGLLGSLELLGATQLRAVQKDLVSVMTTSGQILLHHVNSVLDISKAEADGARNIETDFDLDRLIEDCVANQAGLAATKGLAIGISSPGGPLGWVSGDPARVRQILLNLIGNAVKFTAQGRITIEAERLGHGQPVEIRVIDTGIGIPEADLDRVFDDFVTLDARYDRQAGGTGLGLGISRRVARAIGGEIGVESVLEDGCLFWLRLPLPAAGAAATAVWEVASRPHDTGLTVLVIEDNPVNRFVLCRLLEENGHMVVEAANGAAGVIASMAQAFDVIMTDISMPGLDGIEVTRQIRQHPGPSQHARIIAVTAHALPADHARFRSAGIDDCMTKPITRVNLMAAMTGPAAWTLPELSEQILDRAQIADLEAQLGAQATAELILRVIAEGDRADAEDLWSAGAKNDPRLHALAGTAGTFGARSLQARLAALATARAGNETTEVARLAAGLAGLWRSTREALDAETARLTADQPVAAA
jgi:PAS domain S-box-containing protein